MMRKLAGVFLLLLAFAVPALALGPQDVPRITVQELKAFLERGDNVTVVDVRSKGSYDRSNVKIKGAIRIAPNELNERASVLPMNNELVFYCT